MLKQNDITKMLTKLNEIAEIINHNTETNPQFDYTPNKGEPITYLTAIIRDKVKRGWQPVNDVALIHDQIIQVTITSGNMSIVTKTDEYAHKVYPVKNVTIPEMFSGPSYIDSTVSAVSTVNDELNFIDKEFTRLDEINEKINSKTMQR